ncbi:MAG: adenylyl-sulfate kinase, partial [Candidatus Margulisiibacteriota bacterium]
VRARELAWDKSSISTEERIDRYKHRAKFVLITGKRGIGKRRLAKALERELFRENYYAYYLGVSSLAQGIGSEAPDDTFERENQIQRLGELARIMTESGLIFITTISEMDDDDIQKLKLLNEPFEIMVFNVGPNDFNTFEVDGIIDTTKSDDRNVALMVKRLREKEIFLDFQI